MFALETKQVVVFVTTCFVVHGGGSEGIMEFLENQSPLDYLSLSLSKFCVVCISLSRNTLVMVWSGWE